MSGKYIRRSPRAFFRQRFCLFFFVSPFVSGLVSCNGQTPFIEQSREITATVRVASTDTDALATTRETSSSERPFRRAGRIDGEPEVSDTGASQTGGEGGHTIGGDPGNPVDPDLSSSVGDRSGVDEFGRVRPLPDVNQNVGSSQTPDSQPVVLPPVASIDPTPAPQPEVLPPMVQPEPTPTAVPTAAQPQPTPVTTPTAVPTVAQPQPQPTAAPQPRPGDLVQVVLTQPRSQVDVLWVVDDSGSMAWAQNQLKNQFQSFAQKLKDTRIDFQVGVTSLDVCTVNQSTGYPVPDGLCPDSYYISDGVKVGTSYVGPLKGSLKADPVTQKTILRDTTDFVTAFQRTALLGTKGSAFEHGLWAAKLAVEKAIVSGGVNSGFIRPSAALSVIVLSDEEDDSVQMWCEDGYGRTSLDSAGQKDLNLCREGGLSPFLDAFGVPPFALMKTSKGKPYTTHKYTADQFVSWAGDGAVKGAGNVRVSAITGLRGNSGNIDCSLTSGGPQESGTNYIKAAQLTGGAVENICSSNWSSVLANIGQNTVELATRVSLPQGKIPYAGQLEVRVDGVLLSSSEYSYDVALHAVVFKTPPPMGAEVEVSYRETLVD